jgi:hypothetical protein
VAIGEAAPALASIFHGLVPVRVARSMEEAVRAALDGAPRNGTVVLAPACASQDMFVDYRERGDRFAAAARALAAAKERGVDPPDAAGAAHPGLPIVEGDPMPAPEPGRSRA